MKQYVYNYGTSSISAKRAWAAVFSRTLLNAQALGMLIERVTINSVAVSIWGTNNAFLSELAFLVIQ